MRRGDKWTVAGGKDYAGKPRPIVIVQDNCFDATDSITICAFTTDPTEAPLFRLPVEPNERNGLRSSWPAHRASGFSTDSLTKPRTVKQHLRAFLRWRASQESE